ncbi:hypothetical protein TSUD_154570 [Trifolium subterraneum]|uniref:Uncharacterized protein n=1 Tax=Trifolium subterraneum TaxID=3900 RepID=A0A2Z6PAA5_TRISU|nr:hypothetical protein TSUD_154570 [Trifolium subterraneum]
MCASCFRKQNETKQILVISTGMISSPSSTPPSPTMLSSFPFQSAAKTIFCKIESGVKLCVRGIGLDLCTPLKYQGGYGNWKVRCECGSQDTRG